MWVGKARLDVSLCLLQKDAVQSSFSLIMRSSGAIGSRLCNMRWAISRADTAYTEILYRRRTLRLVLPQCPLEIQVAFQNISGPEAPNWLSSRSARMT